MGNRNNAYNIQSCVEIQWKYFVHRLRLCYAYWRRWIILINFFEKIISVQLSKKYAYKTVFVLLITTLKNNISDSFWLLNYKDHVEICTIQNVPILIEIIVFATIATKRNLIANANVEKNGTQTSHWHLLVLHLLQTPTRVFLWIVSQTKKTFLKKSVVNVFNEVANTTLRVQRRILSKVRMPRVHTLFILVPLPRTLKKYYV